MVTDVTADGPAESAGLRQGDIILEFDGKPVETMKELPRLVADTAIGKKVEVAVWRKGAVETLSVTLGELPEENARLAARDADRGPRVTRGNTELNGLGLTVADVDDRLRRRFKLSEEAEGVVVVDVDGDSDAAEKGIRPGDLLLEIGHESISGTDQAIERLDALRATAGEKPKSVILLLIEGPNGPRYVGLKSGDD